jgi:hypothetical protein
MRDTTILTPQEQYKFDVITKVISKEIKTGHAAKLLGLSPRQILRLRLAAQKQGSNAVIHGLKDKQSNHHVLEEIKEKVLKIIKNEYPDFQPTFASEKLKENYGIKISKSNTRLWMIEANLWKPHKQKKAEHRNWRPRKEYYGELLQFDGSYHMWFEKRYCDALGSPIEVCLLASIDDATGKIIKATFGANEGIHAVFTFWKSYIEEKGKPRNIYLDRFSTYKINHKSAVDNHELITQFQRATVDFDSHLITAFSPQAKGRIERLFGTLQDRLVKELRLAKINTPKEANVFLVEVFLPKFNHKFAVVPTKKGDVHRSLTLYDKKHINRIFSVQSQRVVRNDFTIQFKNSWYQLAEVQPITIRAKEKMLVEEWLDGTLHFSFRGKYLNYLLLPGKPKKEQTDPLILTTHQPNWKPSADHPWRQGYKQKV